MSTDAEIVGRRIRRLRLSKSMSQGALAREIKVDSEQISRWERGRSSPRFENCKKLANALRLCVEVLFHVGIDRDEALEDEALERMLAIARDGEATPSVKLAAAKSLRPKQSSRSRGKSELAEFRRMMEQADVKFRRLVAEIEAERAHAPADET